MVFNSTMFVFLKKTISNVCPYLSGHILWNNKSRTKKTFCIPSDKGHFTCNILVVSEVVIILWNPNPNTKLKKEIWWQITWHQIEIQRHKKVKGRNSNMATTFTIYCIFVRKNDSSTVLMEHLHCMCSSCWEELSTTQPLLFTGTACTVLAGAVTL